MTPHCQKIEGVDRGEKFLKREEGGGRLGGWKVRSRRSYVESEQYSCLHELSYITDKGGYSIFMGNLDEQKMQ